MEEEDDEDEDDKKKKKKAAAKPRGRPAKAKEPKEKAPAKEKAPPKGAVLCCPLFMDLSACHSWSHHASGRQADGLSCLRQLQPNQKWNFLSASVLDLSLTMH